MYSTDCGKCINPDNDSQPIKASSPISRIDDGNEIDCNFLQSLKHSIPMNLRDCGSLMDDKVTQSAKALFPIVTIEDESSTYNKLVQYQNVFSSIVLTLVSLKRTSHNPLEQP